MAKIEYASERKELDFDKNASIAVDKASRPLQAVCLGGHERVSKRSPKAVSAIRLEFFMNPLTLFSSFNYNVRYNLAFTSSSCRYQYLK